MFLDILILYNKLSQHYKFKNNSGSLLMHTANSIHQPKEKSHPIDLTDDMFLYFSDMVISFVFVLGYILGYHV